MSDSLPAISVLMTVFNAEAYLAAAIESIQQQTFRDWEFIIVDDSSTDHSLAIAESYAEKDFRIKIISNAVNKGQTRCLNQGLALARGAWIARQDADDLSHLERLERQWLRIQEDPGLALLGTCGVMINSTGKMVSILDKPLTHEVIAWSAAITNPFLHTSVLFRAEVVQSLGGYDEHYQIAQDYDLWTRIARRYRVANLPGRLVSYRHLESSLSKSGKKTAFQEAHKIAEREEKNSFGRVLLPQERLLIQDFREGKQIKKGYPFRPFHSKKIRPSSELLRSDEEGQYLPEKVPWELNGYKKGTSFAWLSKNRNYQRLFTNNGFNSRDVRPSAERLKGHAEGQLINQGVRLVGTKNLHSFRSKITADQQRLKAIYHLQNAGSQNQKLYHQLKEVAAAFLAAPLYTVRWLKSRF